MDLKILDTKDDERWNAFVDTSAQGSLFSKTWYLKAIGVTYKILAVERNGEICAGIILANNNGKWTFGAYQKYTGVLFADFEGSKYVITTNQRNAVKLLMRELNNLGDSDYFFHPQFFDWLLFYHNGFKQTTYYTYRIQLAGLTDADILNLAAPRLRTKIRKATADQTLSVITDIDPAEFYKVNAKTFTRKGEKMPITQDRFTAIYNALHKHKGIKLYALKHKSKGIASVLGIAYDNRAAYLLFSGFDEELKDAGYNELLIHTAICDAAQKVQVFDFEGSMMPGIESFYRQFGGDFTPYYRIYKLSLVEQAGQSIKKQLKKLLP